MGEKLTDKQKIAKYAETEKLNIAPKVSEKTDTEKTGDQVSLSVPAADTPKEVKKETESVETPPDTEKDPAKELEAAMEDARQKQDRLMRVSAEFENYKKRVLREMNDSRKFANETLIRELLPVIDNLERALVSTEANSSHSAVNEGVGMTLKEVVRILEKYGVKKIEALGQPFDPYFHQAFSREETDAYPENTVAREYQKGYMLHDRLLRPAMVAVAAPKTTAETEAASESPAVMDFDDNTE